MSSRNRTLDVYASAARTADPTIPILEYDGFPACHLVIAVTAGAGLSLVFTIQGAMGTDYYDILASASITGVGVTVLKVGPGITAAANLSVSDFLPGRWRVKAVHSNGVAATYSVRAFLMGASNG